MKSSWSLEVGFKKPERLVTVNMKQMLPQAGSWIRLYFDMKVMKQGSVIGLIFVNSIHLLSNL